jgi:hypothetical protein
MKRFAFSYQQLATTLAFVMVTSVALPVAALACDAMQERCPQLGIVESEGSAPCHPSEEIPESRHVAVCCAVTPNAVFDTAPALERHGVHPLTVWVFNQQLSDGLLLSQAPRIVASDHRPAFTVSLGLPVLHEALLI